MITFECSSCRRKLNAPDEKAGKRVKCPNCQAPVVIPAPVAASETATAAPDVVEPSLDFTAAPVSYAPRKKQKTGQRIVVAGLLLSILAVVGGYAALKLWPESPRLALPKINDATIQEQQPVKFEISASRPAGFTGNVRYELVKGASGAELHPEKGQFAWTPSEAQGPGTYDFTIRATSDDGTAAPGEASFQFTVEEYNEPPQFTPVEAITAAVGDPVELTLAARDPDVPAVDLTYRLLDGAPPGATFDPATRQFRWTPTAEHEGRKLAVMFEANEPDGGLNAVEIVHITVSTAVGPSESLLDELRTAGANVKFREYGSPLPIAGAAQVVDVDGQPLTVFEYADDKARTTAAEQVAADVKAAEGDEPPTARFYQKERLIAVYDGGEDETLQRLTAIFGEPFAVGRLSVKSDEPQPEPTAETSPADVARREFDDRLYQLYDDNLLLVRKRYKDLRGIYADYFEATQQPAIAAAFGENQAEMLAWLNEHVDIKQELFSAIDPQSDDVVAALKLFSDLKTQFPDKIVPYANLAIAIAVVWDQEDRGVYDYEHHQVRVHAKMPDGLVGAVENFRYFVETENKMQGRAQYLPWEFLTHLVNHRTPLSERDWALANYLNRRVQFGKCYSDVPYDREMLNSNDLICKMDGKDYTLANLLEFGGVCAQQADFAARVGKSLGVPAAYVRGESNSGEYHAWVMWIELKQVTPKSIAFELLSHGRYLLDEYYVGTLFDPQTNRLMTDRELELQLHVVGMDPLAHRHAAMVMAAYPMIRERAEMDATAQLVFLRKVADLCPGHPEIWRALAAMSRDGVIAKQHSRQMSRSLELFFTTFANYPDFVWSVFDDLVAHRTELKEKVELYVRLVQMFESVGRPDLACDARLKLCDYQVEARESKAAIEGLAYTIKKFPGEGRYVPKLLDRLEQICANVDGTDPLLVKFYQEFLPTIPTHRGNETSKYCVAMFRRGIEFFRTHGQADLATQFQNQLQQIQSGRVAS